MGMLMRRFWGQINVSGLTANRLRAELTSRLKEYVNEPKVTVIIAEYRSQPVSQLRALNSPGVYHLTGSNTLIQMLSQAGGLRPDAGSFIEITRRKIWGTIPAASAILRASSARPVLP
jgi:polysaccharide export outer membrane protein